VDYSYLDKDEYKGIPVVRIEENNNGLPFLIVRLEQRCNLHPHRHEFVQIVYISRGKLKHVLHRTVFDVYRGDIFIIPPYVPHYFIDEGADPYEIIEFEFVPEFIDERFSSGSPENSFMDFAYLEPFLVVEKEIKPRLNLSGTIQVEVEALFSEILREYETRDSDYQLLIRALLQKLLVLVGREFKRNISGTASQELFDRHRDALFQAIAYIDENLSGAVSVEEAARVAMLSQSYFRYLFKRMFQKSFVEYVNERRIARAAELIRTRPDMLIVDVCFEAGFNSVTHFNRVFRQTTGATPTAFRKSIRSGQV
jgi:AraC-like DNA-binding protein/mannose-6-phosphate isomerase-like protein (cupin superfamily)